MIRPSEALFLFAVCERASAPVRRAMLYPRQIREKDPALFLCSTGRVSLKK